MAGKLLCEPCLYVKIKTEAVGFCSTCAECLCSKCVFEHRKAKMTRTHSVQQDITPKHTEIIQAMNTMITCPVHTGMKIAYRCSDHDVCVCTVCRVDTHRNCDNVFEIAKTDNAETELSNTRENLAKLKDSAASVRKGKEENKSNLYQNQTQILSEQEAIIQQAIDELEEFKVQLRQETNEQLQIAVSEIDKDIEAAGVIEKTSARNQDILEAAFKYGDNECPKVIAHLLAETMVKHKDLVSDLQKKDELKLNFERNPNSIVVSTPGIVSVTRYESDEPKADRQCGIETTSDEVSEADVDNLFAGKPTLNKPSSLAGDLCVSNEVLVNVRGQSDKNICLISGSVLLQDGQLVIIDFNNSSIKLLSPDFILLHTLRLPGKPVRACAIDSDKVAVSFGRVKRINRYSVGDNKITYEGGFPTALFSHGIAFDGSHIFAIMSDEDFTSNNNAKDDTIQVEVRNPYDGSIIDVIREFKVVGNKSWSLVLNNTQAIHFTEDNSMVIAELNRVLCFDLLKQSKRTVAVEKRFYVCSGEILKNSIENIASDSDSIYVCTSSGDVLQISASDFNVNRVILSALGMDFRSITVDVANSRIILGCEDDDNMHVYKLQKSL